MYRPQPDVGTNAFLRDQYANTAPYVTQYGQIAGLYLGQIVQPTGLPTGGQATLIPVAENTYADEDPIYRKNAYVGMLFNEAQARGHEALTQMRPTIRPNKRRAWGNCRTRELEFPDGTMSHMVKFAYLPDFPSDLQAQQALEMSRRYGRQTELLNMYEDDNFWRAAGVPFRNEPRKE